MIEVRIVKVHDEHEGGEEALGIIKIESLTPGYNREPCDYSVRFAVERAGAVGLHQRTIIGYPRLKYNVLGLLTQALATLDPKELELEDGTSASDLARRQHRPLQALQAWAGRLYHH